LFCGTNFLELYR